MFTESRSVRQCKAQDTRHTRKLLTYFGLSSRLYSFHEHNEHEKESQVRYDHATNTKHLGFNLGELLHWEQSMLRLISIEQ